MVRTVKQFTISLRNGREVYQCDLPDHCPNALDRIARFYRARQVRELTIGIDGVRGRRGSFWGDLTTTNDLRHRHEIQAGISHENGAPFVVCHYRFLGPQFSWFSWPRRSFSREVEDLEAFLRNPSTAVVPAALTPRRRRSWFKRIVVDFPLRIFYGVYRVLSWLRHRSARRLTSAGAMVLVALMAAGMIGVDTETTVAYQAFAPLLFLLLIAAGFSWTFRARFTAERRLPRFGTVGEPFTYSAVLKNLGPRLECDLAVLENLNDPRPAFAEWKAVQLADERRALLFRSARSRRSNPFRVARVRSASLPPAPPGATVEARLELTPLRRGVIRFAGLTLARPDPFGLWRAFCKLPLPQSMLILPRRYSLPPIALPGTVRYQEGGVALAANVGQSDEFVALRDYRRGDPLRHIHWRSWAKAGRPIVKEFEDEFFVRHALVLDTFTTDPHSEAFEEAVSVAASFACTIQIQESLLDLLFVGTQAYCFTAGRGLAHSDQMLEILASVGPCADKPFRALEHLVLDRVAALSGCICVLLSWDEERRAFVEKLRALGLPLLVLVVRDSGRRDPLDPGPMGDQPGRFHALEAGRIEEGLERLT